MHRLEARYTLAIVYICIAVGICLYTRYIFCLGTCTFVHGSLFYININFPCSADHEQDWQPYPADPYSCYMCDCTYILHAFICVTTTTAVCMYVCMYVCIYKAGRPVVQLVTSKPSHVGT